MMLLLNAKGPHPRGEGKRRTRLCLLIAAFMAFSPLAHAFDLQQLSEQLAKPHVIHGDFIPGISPVPVTNRDVLFEVAESAIEDLAGHGIDAMTVELVLDMLHTARDMDGP